MSIIATQYRSVSVFGELVSVHELKLLIISYKYMNYMRDYKKCVANNVCNEKIHEK